MLRKIQKNNLNWPNRNGPKCKKANRRSEKLFIGLTTKPCPILKNETKTTQLSFQMLTKNIVLYISFFGQKSTLFPKCFPKSCGLDGTRTRDPMRDRHVF